MSAVANSNATAVVTINDAGIAISDHRGLCETSPAFALAENGSLVLGDKAKTSARLNPRATYNRFWQQLDQEPLNRPAAQAQSHADIAYFHLKDIWQRYLAEDAENAPEEVLIAVPSYMPKTALALLLGIAKSCGLPVVGMVESAVAATSTVQTQGSSLLLDISLHQATSTEISNTGELRLGSTEILSKQGLVKLEDFWVQMIAKQFLQETRFDALHDAASEQAVYHKLPEWLAALQNHPVTSAALETGTRKHITELNLKQFEHAAETIYQPLIKAATQHKGLVLLSHRLQQLPGLLHELKQVANCVALAEDAPAQGALGHAAAIRSDPNSPSFITQLPSAIQGASRPENETEGQLPASHLLCGDIAYGFADAPLLLGETLRNLNLGETAHAGLLKQIDGQAFIDIPGGLSAQISLNGEQLSGQHAVSSGDTLHIKGFNNDQPLRLISVLAKA